MVERAAGSNGFRVGYGAVRLGAAADTSSVVRRVRPALEALSEQTGETVSLALVRAVSLVYVDHLSVIGAAFQPWTEERISLHSTSSGKIFLAWLSHEEREGALPARLEPFTESTIADRGQLETRGLDRARQLGYATCLGEDAALTNGVSAAALDARTRPFAVVNVWGPERRIPQLDWTARAAGGPGGKPSGADACLTRGGPAASSLEPVLRQRSTTRKFKCTKYGSLHDPPPN